MWEIVFFVGWSRCSNWLFNVTTSTGVHIHYSPYTSVGWKINPRQLSRWFLKLITLLITKSNTLFWYVITILKILKKNQITSQKTANFVASSFMTNHKFFKNFFRHLGWWLFDILNFSKIQNKWFVTTK